MSLNRIAEGLRLLAGVGCAGLVLGAALPAQASTVPHLSARQALAALPSSAALPGGQFYSEDANDEGSSGYFEGCEENRRAVLHETHVMNEDYFGDGTLSGQGDKPDTRHDNVQIWVFASAAAADSAMTKVIAQERSCPKTWTEHDNGATQVTVRVSRAAYSPGGWRGLVVEQTSHGVLAPGEPHFAGRDAQVLISRGNVMLDISVADGQAPLTLARDLAAAKQLAHLVAARVS